MPRNVNTALRKGDFSLFRNLVESGVDVNLKDDENQTPLIICCLHNGQKWAVGSARLLLTFGAKVGLCDKMGRNALMYAVMYQREGLVKLFVDALDYDLTHTDKWNRTALSYATSSGDTTIKTMLIKTLNKYCLLSETPREKKFVKDKSGFQTPPINHSNAVQKPFLTTNGTSRMRTTHALKNKFKATGGQSITYSLPYKTIPAEIWEKRMKLYSGVKKHQSSACLCGATTNSLSTYAFPKNDSSTGIQDKTAIKPKERNDGKCKSEHSDWREDFQNIMAMLEVKLSPSYCKEARILPFNQRKNIKVPNAQLDDCKAPQISRRGRRRSFDTMDVLLDKQPIKGNARRRCSLAVISLIALKGFKSSLSDEHGKQNRNSLSIPKPALKKLNYVL